MLSAIGKAAIRRVGVAPSGGGAQQIHRVLLNRSRSNGLQSKIQDRTLPILVSGKRFYVATATAIASKPAEPASKTAGTQAENKVTRRASPAKKTAATTKPRTAAKSKKAAKPTKPKRKVLTERQQAKKVADKEKREAKKTADKEKAKVKALKAKEKKAADKQKAKLMDLKAKVLTPPKSLPETALRLVVKEAVTPASVAASGTSVTSVLKEAATSFKTMDASKREIYNHQANENKSTNAAELEAWVLSHTPQQIYNSNRASNVLQRLGKAKGRKIVDPRLPKKPLAPHSYFIKERFASGDMKGISVTEAAKVLNQEYKNLSPAERKTYEDRAQARKDEYEKGMVALFGTIHPIEKFA